MKVLKLNKQNKQLYVPNNPTAYGFAIEYGWTFIVVEVDDNFILDSVLDIT